MAVTLVLDHYAELPGAVERFAGWNGPVGDTMRQAARMATRESKRAAPVKVGTLRASIAHNTGERRRNAKGIWFTVGSKQPYALWMESGTRPHLIKPKHAGGKLVFFWPRVGHVVRLAQVRHPGTKAYRYLEKGLVKTVRRLFG